MENERKTDRSADMGMDEHRLSDILLASQIKATDIYETPPQIIWIDNSTIATLGNFSASTGKAKSKKTFNVSALVAASLAGKQVLNYRAHLPEGKQRILYVDTEQSRFHCRSVLERILRLAGLPTTTDPENLDFFCLREYSPSVRVEVIDYALRQNKGYGLVIIDGIRDLMLDINSTGESVEVINRMMEWSSRYDLHIHCVLHLNKGDNNVRGHIGTEMSNKAVHWDRQIPLEALWEQYRRITKPGSPVILFAQGIFSARLMLSQPRMWRYNLVWRKDRVTGHLNANRMPLRQHEDIIVFYDRQPVYHPQMMPCPPERKNHGRRKTDGFTNRCYGEMKLAPVRVAEDKYPTSVISIPKEHKTGAFYHPTQKPVALIEYLMRTYTNEGDVVLDNCIGSGTTAIAAIRTGRHYIGFEIEPTYCEIAGRRIREELERGHGIKESEIREIKK